MDKSKKTMLLVVCVILLANLWTTISLKEKITNLQNQLGQTQGQLYQVIDNTSQEINSLRQDLLDKIAQGDSLLSTYDTEVSYKEGQLECLISVVPKELHTGELVYLTIGAEKKEAATFNGSDYTATFQVAPTKSIVPVVSFEAAAGVRQETLPEVLLDDYLSLGYDADLTTSSEGKGILTISLYAANEKSFELISGVPSVTAIVKDTVTGVELGRVAMQPDSNEMEPLKEITYQAALKEYTEKEGSYSVSAEITTKNGLLYQAEIAAITYEVDDNQRSTSGNFGSTGTIMPIW